jgi:CRP/FNR family cyclic AMP-dependent transcriptional regulator
MATITDLKKQVLFEDIDDKHLEKIAKKLQTISVRKNSYIFKEKEDTKGIYLIHSGKLEISKTTPDGWKQTLAVLGDGHFFGELSILEKRRHEANAVALEDTTLFLLSKDEFEKIENEDLVLANVILKKLAFVLSKNLRRMNDKFLNVLVNY